MRAGLRSRRRGRVCASELVKEPSLQRSVQSAAIVNFLRRRYEPLSQAYVPVARESQSRELLREGFLTKARWRNCWRDVLVVLDADKIETYGGNQKVPQSVIALCDILSVHHLEPKPFSSNTFIEIETEQESHYFFSKNEDLARSWVDDINAARARLAQRRRDGSLGVDVKKPVVLAKRRPGESDNRVILNNYRLCWSSSAHPCKLSRSLLLEIILVYQQFIDDNRQFSSSVRMKFNAFSKRVADLQVMQVAKLKHAEKVAFFVNIYHCLCLHAYLELGDIAAQAKNKSFAGSGAPRCPSSCGMLV